MNHGGKGWSGKRAHRTGGGGSRARRSPSSRAGEANAATSPDFDAVDAGFDDDIFGAKQTKTQPPAAAAAPSAAATAAPAKPVRQATPPPAEAAAAAKPVVEDSADDIAAGASARAAAIAAAAEAAPANVKQEAKEEIVHPALAPPMAAAAPARAAAAPLPAAVSTPPAALQSAPISKSSTAKASTQQQRSGTGGSADAAAQPSGPAPAAPAQREGGPNPLAGQIKLLQSTHAALAARVAATEEQVLHAMQEPDESNNTALWQHAERLGTVEGDVRGAWEKVKAVSESVESLMAELDACKERVQQMQVHLINHFGLAGIASGAVSWTLHTFLHSM